MKILWKKREWRNILFILFLIFTPTFCYANLACTDCIFDFDDDNHLASWIKDVIFIELRKTNRSWVDFQIDFELWNPGPFVIYYQSSTTALGLPYSIKLEENVNTTIESTDISANDGGGLVCSSTLIRPGVHSFTWNGTISFNNTFVNNTAPIGKYTFKIGNEKWIKIYPFIVQIDEKFVNKTYTEKPVDWRKRTIYLGNPPLTTWLGLGITSIYLTLVIRREKNKATLEKA